MTRRDFLVTTPLVAMTPGLAAAADAESPPPPAAEWARARSTTPDDQHHALRQRNAAARARDPRPNILLVFTDDHGEGMAAHHWVTKLGFWEEVVRVPLIVVPPGSFNRPAPRVESELPVSLLDFMPTALDYAGVPTAEWPTQRGQSLRPALEGRPLQREFVVTALDPSPQRPDDTARMVVTADGWKYCRYSSGDRAEQFFDLNTDPGETCNLIADAAAARQRDRLRALLRVWLKQTNDDFEVP